MNFSFLKKVTVVLAGGLLVAPLVASAITVDELRDQVDELLAQISQIQSTNVAQALPPLDATPPNVDIVIPKDGATYDKTPIFVAIGAGDNVTHYKKIQIRLENVTTASGGDKGYVSYPPCTPYGCNAFDVFLVQGENILRATATDEAGNQTVDEVKVYYNPPTINPIPQLSHAEAPAAGDKNVLYSGETGRIFGNDIDSKFVLYFIDSNGKEVEVSKTANALGTQIEFTTPNLISGMYEVVLMNEGGHSSNYLLVQVWGNQGGLSENQINGTIGLLDNWGVSATNLHRVRVALGGGAAVDSGGSNLTLGQLDALEGLLKSFGASNEIIENILFILRIPGPSSTLRDPGFESLKDFWTHSAWNSNCSNSGFSQVHKHSGLQSIEIDCHQKNDARYSQKVLVQPNTDYVLSGWIKTDNVQHWVDNTGNTNQAGANIGLLGRWDRTQGLFGTNDWTYQSVEFRTGPNETEVEVAVRLGHWSGEATGTAWFDDLNLEGAGVDPLPFAAPSNLMVERTSNGLHGDANLLRWQNNATYSIVEGVVLRAGTEQIFRVAGSAESYIDDSAIQDGRYTYRIRGISTTDVPSAWSDWTSIIVGDLVPPPPVISDLAVPTDLGVQRTNNGLFGDANLLTWKNNATYSTVEGRVQHSTTQTQTFLVAGSAQSYIHDSSTGPGTYIYRVRGIDGNGRESDWSEGVSITVLEELVSTSPLNVVSCDRVHASGGAGPDGLTTTAIQGTHHVFAYGVEGASKVDFQVWSEVQVDGRATDDVVWYPGELVPGSNGTWRGAINLARHRQGNPDYGQIFVFAWVYGQDGSPAFCDGAHFTRVHPDTSAGIGPLGAGLMGGIGDVFNYVLDTFPSDNPVTNPPALKMAKRIVLPGEDVSAGVIGSIKHAVRDVRLMMQGL